MENSDDQGPTGLIRRVQDIDTLNEAKKVLV
jgi:Ca-activated chloride channel homolog